MPLSAGHNNYSAELGKNLKIISAALNGKISTKIIKCVFDHHMGHRGYLLDTVSTVW